MGLMVRRRQRFLHWVVNLGDAEIREHRAAFDEEDVRRLDVAMHNASGVDPLEGIQEVATDFERVAPR
jgi:hypothetical protein